MTDKNSAKPTARKTPARSAATKKPAARSTAKAAAADAADETAEAVDAATTEAVDSVADAVELADGPIADAADTAAETVAEAANEAAVGVAVAAEAAAIEAETVATEAQGAAAAPVRTIYVTAPQPPAKKGNQVLGVLVALLAAAVFAVLHTVVFAIITTVQGGSAAQLIPAFLQSGSLIWPVVIVFVVTALWAQLVNRAGWWSWVLGSFVVAAAVYAGSVLIFQFVYQAPIQWSDPLVIASAVLAREIVVWLGGLLSVRGKRLKVRNAEALAQFNREEAERRANREYAD